MQNLWQEQSYLKKMNKEEKQKRFVQLEAAYSSLRLKVTVWAALNAEVIEEYVLDEWLQRIVDEYSCAIIHKNKLDENQTNAETEKFKLMLHTTLTSGNEENRKKVLKRLVDSVMQLKGEEDHPKWEDKKYKEQADLFTDKLILKYYEAHLRVDNKLHPESSRYQYMNGPQKKPDVK